MDLQALRLDEKPAASGAPSSSRRQQQIAAPIQEEEEEVPVQEEVEEEPREDVFAAVPIKHSEVASLHLFDTDVESFVEQRSEVQIQIAEAGEYEYWLVVRDAKEPFISVPVDSELVPRLDPAHNAFMFSFTPQDEASTTWSALFPDEEAFIRFKDAFTQYMWEGRNKTSWGKAKADEKKYVAQTYEDVEMTDVSGEPFEEDEEEDEESEAEDALNASSSFDEESESETERFAKAAKGKNEKLTVGYKNDRSFVVRGDMIGVFKHTDDDKLKFATAINRITDTQGKSFTPNKVGPSTAYDYIAWG